jgi:chromosome segregation ATPase
MSRVKELQTNVDLMLEANKEEIAKVEKQVEFLKADKKMVETELAEAVKQVEALKTDLKQVREDLNNGTEKLQALSKEQKALTATAKVLSPKV